jgi:hypothetical protein
MRCTICFWGTDNELVDAVDILMTFLESSIKNTNYKVLQHNNRMHNCLPILQLHLK